MLPLCTLTFFLPLCGGRLAASMLTTAVASSSTALSRCELRRWEERNRNAGTCRASMGWADAQGTGQVWVLRCNMTRQVLSGEL